MKIFSSFIIALIFLSAGCTKDTKYQYEVNDVEVGPEGSEKDRPKSTTQFISIAYADLFGATIPQTKLINLSVAYSSFGDLKVIEERIISNFINDPAVQLPAQVSVNGDTAKFITDCYKKFYNRQPDEFEKFRWLQLIRSDANITP